MTFERLRVIAGVAADVIAVTKSLPETYISLMTEDEIAEGCVRLDEMAINQFLTCNRPLGLWIAAKKLPLHFRAMVAEDVVQDASIEWYAELQLGRHVAKDLKRRYLKKIQRRAIDMCRHENAELRARRRAAVPRRTSDRTPAEQLSVKEALQVIRDQMSPEDLRIFEQYVVEERSWNEIAKAGRRTPEALRQRWSRFKAWWSLDARSDRL